MRPVPHSRRSSLSATASPGPLSGCSDFKSTPGSQQLAALWSLQHPGGFHQLRRPPVIFACACEQPVQCSLYSIQTVDWHPCTHCMFQFHSSPMFCVAMRVLHSTSMHHIPTMVPTLCGSTIPSRGTMARTIRVLTLINRLFLT